MAASTLSGVPAASTAQDRVRAVVTLLGAIFMVWANVAVVQRQLDVSTSVAVGNIVPAPWAFAIWGVIFLLSMGFGVYAVLPSNPGRELVHAVGYPAAAAFVTAGLWPVATAYAQFDLAQVLIVAMWLLLAVVYRRIIMVQVMTDAERWLSGLTFGLFFGWVTAANAVSIQARIIGWGASERTVAISGIVALIVAGLIAGWFIRQGQPGPRQMWIAYAFAVAWALVAIVIRQIGAAPSGVAAAAVAAIPAAAAVVSGLRPGAATQPAEGRV